MSERLAYSIEEAGQLIGISRDLIYDLLRQDQLGSIKVGRRRIITRQQLDSYLTSSAAA